VRLTWVNHASFLLESDGVRLVCDPWIEGAVFNNGWKHISKTKMGYEDFAGVTHIWFSHEHPDHFFPPNLKKIPESIRRQIQVLFHETRDKRVVRACESLGFSVRELPDGMPARIAEDFKVINGVNELIDSWLLIFAEGKTVLNLNDCVFPRKPEMQKIKRLAGEVDLLLSQFSYANWVGNPDDVAAQRSHAERKRSEMTAQIRAMQPRQFIPFASYVYFCHAENFFMNGSVNRIGDIHRFVTQELAQDTVVLYPGDEWEVGARRESGEAIRKYEADLSGAQKAEPLTSAQVPVSQLQKAMEDLREKCRSKNNFLLINAMAPAVVRLSDLGVELEVSYRRGIREVKGREPDLILSSDSLMYCIQTGWGGETLKINGRYEVPAQGNPERFFRLFRVPQYNSYGDSVNFGFVTARLFEAVRRHAAV